MNYFLFVDDDDSGGGDGGDAVDSIERNGLDPHEDSWMLLMSYQTSNFFARLQGIFLTLQICYQISL